MPTAQLILTHSPDLAELEAVSSLTESDVVVVGLVDTGSTPKVHAAIFPAETSQHLSEAFALVKASTKLGSTTHLPAPDGVPGKSVLAVGLGTAAPASEEELRRAAGAAARACRGLGSALFALDGQRPESVALGAGLGSYRPAKVSSENGSPESASSTEENSSEAAAAHHADVIRVYSTVDGFNTERASAIAWAVGTARDLVNTPPNLLFPASFAERAVTLGQETGLEVEVLDEAALAEGGFGGILGVGAGSSRPPRLVRLTHRVDAERPTVALVGKGITFDTGGISIKPAAGMQQMTMDMGGAAAVLATVLVAARLGVDATVIATLPMAENMPSGTSYRPGDVLTMYGGTTVEVLNTDAEGRLILADAIVRACEDNPDYLIETATLTGAQMVALGKLTPGVMGEEAFRDRVAKLSAEVGENGWPMPLPEEIRDGLDSAVADLANVGPDRWGGMLAAGLFLAEFVAEGVPWAHIDVAGPAYNDGSPTGYLPKGGTGVPVRTMLAALEDIAERG